MSRGVERLRTAFEAARLEDRAAVVPYLVAGYPDLRRSRRLVMEAVEAGADAIELGIPFSDPVADGPTIQAALHHALEAGTRPADVLGMVHDLRQDGVETPILAMTYANVFWAPGLVTTARRLATAGVDGTIVPDLPLEESAEYRRLWRHRGLATVLLATPATPKRRLQRLADATTGFLYLVAVYGTTGARNRVAPETRRLLGRVEATGRRAPALVGFGVSQPQHVATLRRLGADGVVVGSALVDAIRTGRSVGRLLAALRRAGTAAGPAGRAPNGPRAVRRGAKAFV